MIDGLMRSKHSFNCLPVGPTVRIRTACITIQYGINLTRTHSISIQISSLASVWKFNCRPVFAAQHSIQLANGVTCQKCPLLSVPHEFAFSKKASHTYQTTYYLYIYSRGLLENENWFITAPFLEEIADTHLVCKHQR